MIAPWRHKQSLAENTHGGAEAHLSAFNQQVLQQQEDAYTLAFYLLGSAEAAAQAVQTAVVQTYQRDGHGSARLNLLRAVLKNCLGPAIPVTGGDALTRGILALPQDERRTMLLVDVLGLSYVEAAQVLGTSTGRVSQWLTGARLAMRATPIAA